MSPQALLCSPDPQAVAALQRILNSSGVELEICSQAEAGMCRLNQEKFDAVFVDCDDMPLGAELLRELRKTPSNRKAIAFALLHGTTDTRRAYALGANFTLEKPLTVDFTTRTLRAATGLMLRERRRYFRQDVAASIQLWVRTAAHSGLITNLSETGMRLAQVELKQGTKVRFQFTLPWTEIVVNGNGVVAWTGDGIAGVRWNVSRPLQQTLEDWVNDRAFRDKTFSSQVQDVATFAVPLATVRGRRARA
jgi:DNA-binding response OmpR family regulator